MADIHIPDSLARRLDLETSWKREVARGIAQADAGKLLPAEQVMKRARRLLERHARRKTAR